MDGLKLYLQQSGKLISKNGIIMVGRTTTMSHPYFAFAPMGRFQLPFSTSLDQYTTVRLLSSEKYTNWRMSICRRGQSAALTWHSATHRGIIYINRARIFWGLLHPHVGREFKIYKRKERQHLHGRQQSGECSHCRLLSPNWRINLYTKREESNSVEDDGVYNMQARMLGINQILNTYMPRLMWDANEDVKFKS